jgi:hypothetical protein
MKGGRNAERYTAGYDIGSYEGLLMRAIIPGIRRCMSGKTSSL